MKNYLTISAVTVFCLIAGAASAEEHQHGSDAVTTAATTQKSVPVSVNDVKGARIVFLLTTDDPNRATHALHIAKITHDEDHPTAIILLTKGARLASKDLPQPVSPLTEISLRDTINPDFSVEHSILVVTC